MPGASLNIYSNSTFSPVITDAVSSSTTTYDSVAKAIEKASSQMGEILAVDMANAMFAGIPIIADPYMPKGMVAMISSAKGPLFSRNPIGAAKPRTAIARDLREPEQIDFERSYDFAE